MSDLVEIFLTSRKKGERLSRLEPIRFEPDSSIEGNIYNFEHF